MEGEGGSRGTRWLLGLLQQLVLGGGRPPRHESLLSLSGHRIPYRAVIAAQVHLCACWGGDKAG